MTPSLQNPPQIQAVSRGNFAGSVATLATTPALQTFKGDFQAPSPYSRVVITEPVMAELRRTGDPQTVTLGDVTTLLNDEMEFLTDWQIAVALLPERDPVTEFYRIKDIADVLGVRRQEQVQRLARELWPRRRRCAGNGNYQLTLDEAAQLIRAYIFRGKLTQPQGEMAARLADRLFTDFRRAFRVKLPQVQR